MTQLGSNQYKSRGPIKERTAGKITAPSLQVPMDHVPIWKWSPDRLQRAGYIMVQPPKHSDGYPTVLKRIIPRAGQSQQDLALLVHKHVVDDEIVQQIRVRPADTKDLSIGHLDDTISKNLLEDRRRGGKWRIVTPWAVINANTNYPHLYVRFEHKLPPLDNDYQPIDANAAPKVFPIRGIIHYATPSLLQSLRSVRSQQTNTLIFERDINNPYDTNAVAVCLANPRVKLGYVPAQKVAPTLSKELDHGYQWTIQSYWVDPANPPKWVKINKIIRAE